MGLPKKYTTSYQGKAIVESNGSELLVMFPDGHIEPALDPKEAFLKLRRFFKKNLQTDVGVGEIEWRHGVEPPAGT